MKTIYKTALLISVLLAALAAASCTGRDVDLPVSDGINITFRTAAASEVQVKGTPVEGDDSFNENLLNSVYYFFYPQGQTSVAPSVSGYKTGISETETYQVKIPVSANTIVNDLYASSNECQLFAVANPPASLVSALEGKPTLTQLRAMTVASSLINVPQSNFTLVYDGPLAAASLSQKVSVNAVIEMQHLAAKFTIGAIVIPSITQGADTYTPDGLSVSFCNGINKTTLGGWDKDIVDSDDYFKTDYKAMAADGTVTVGTDTFKKFTLSTPIYSYPMEWEFNSASEPYLMYELRWKITNDSGIQYKSLYYKMTLGRREIMQNEWYDISGKLSVLGSLYPEEPKEIYYYMDYIVNGWKNALSGDDVNTPATIKDTRYLAVNQTEWVINNKEDLVVPFSSSHDCTVEVLSATKTSFYKTSGDYGEHTTVDVKSSVSTSFIDTKSQLRVRRPLNNTLGSGTMDISPINIKLRISHSDNSSFYSDVTITQYPAIWVETVLNSAGQNGSSAYGYILIDGTRNSTNGSIAKAEGASGNITTDGNNTSRWFTIIHVNQFDEESNSENFVIGDPRKIEVDNLTDMWSKISGSPNSVATAYRKYEKTNGVLSYYHPTIPARSGEQNSRKLFVAPSFRVCTAHCKNSENNTYPEAVLRCATYQEDGYPAGRWRLPTYAEIKLFRLLSNANMIPNLFYAQGRYTYAGGQCNGTTFTDGISADNTDMGAARCVYDEWYWSQVDAKMGWDNSNKTTFTWGDVPDNFVIPSN